jgi:sulfhydrogenase subunit beta (sulfur reductase)
VLIQLSRAELLGQLQSLSAEFAIFVPVAEEKQVKLKQFAGEIYTGNRLPANSVKELVLPQREFLVKYHWQKEPGYTGETVEPVMKKTIVFGRPCDIRAIHILDRVFTRDKVDDQYLARRDQLVTVSMACDSPCQTCFCNLVGGGPFDEAGSDLICLANDDSFTFKSLTSKGESLLKLVNGKEINDDVFSAPKATAEAKLDGKSVSLEELKAKTYRKFKDPIWEELGKRCLGCGTCTYLCPTCHCFDIQEEVKGSRGVRVRNWDSCQFANFTLHASGHNPRPSQAERMRQRFEHKLSYMPENIDTAGCVGCGRCVVFCPVNIDIREVINQMLEGKDE